MQAVRLHAYDQRPSVDDVDEPTITGPSQVLVRIGGAGLCRTDLHIVQGMWADKTGIDLPYILGHENAGWVEQVGSAVENVAVGDAVIVHPLRTCGVCRPCRAGDDMHCLDQLFPGIDTDGGDADLLKTVERALVPLPDGLEPKDVAAHADAGLTAYHAVKKAARMLEPGHHVVVVGAGGLGHIGVQSLRAMSGATITVVDTRQETLELARGWGAEHTVLADDAQVDTVMELTDGLGAEAVIDFVGEFGVIDDAIAMLRPHGSYYVVGYGEPLHIPTIDIISSEISFVGNLVGTYLDLVELMELARQGRVGLHTTEYPLAGFNDALADLEAGRLQGRGILVPDGS